MINLIVVSFFSARCYLIRRLQAFEYKPCADAVYRTCSQHFFNYAHKATNPKQLVYTPHEITTLCEYRAVDY